MRSASIKLQYLWNSSNGRTNEELKSKTLILVHETILEIQASCPHSSVDSSQKQGATKEVYSEQWLWDN
jgi:hypothetical protein